MGKIKIGIRKILVGVLWYLPNNIAHKILYVAQMRKRLNLKDPKDFNEKIQWLIVNRYGEQEAKLTDKYMVRHYIKQKGYENILPKLYKTYKNANEINIDLLPQKFVLKTNHGCGATEICVNKKTFNLDKAKKNLKKSLKTNYAKKSLEYHYQYIEPCIVCEEYINDGTGVMPIDYKIYCFKGKPKCILVCTNRDKELNLDYYDLDWNYLNYSKENYRSLNKIEKPENLEEMLKIASDLSKDYKFVRVDLYNANGSIKFSEMTFTPAAGLIKYNTKEALEELGKELKIGEE